MVNRLEESGDIIKLRTKKSVNQSAQLVLVISNSYYNLKCQQLIICPINDIKQDFPLHVKISQVKTKGVVMCEHVLTVQKKEFYIEHVEKLPVDLLEEVLAINSSFFYC